MYDFPRQEDIIIIPIGDVHYGALEHKKKEWQAFCEYVATTDNVYLALIGDLIDTGLKNSKTDSYKQTATPFEQCRTMIENLKPIADKILCYVEGNHEYRVIKDTSFSPTQMIAEACGYPERYRESMGFITCRFGHGERNLHGYQRPTYNIACLHGSAKTRMDKLGYAVECDVLCTGHTHEPYTHPKMRYKIDNCNKRVIPSNFYHISVSSWLDWGGYGMRASYIPQPTVIEEIHLKGNRKNISIFTKSV